jgi:hypothetical protein
LRVPSGRRKRPRPAPEGYKAEQERLRKEHGEAKREETNLEAKQARLIHAIENGIGEDAALIARFREVSTLLAGARERAKLAAAPSVVTLHLNFADRYLVAIKELEQILTVGDNAPQNRVRLP